MKYRTYAIFDSATEAFMRPFFMAADGAAERAFIDLATSADHEVGKHPEHYSLFFLGTFDDNNGEMKPEGPRCLLTAANAIAGSRKIEKAQMALLEGDELE